MPTAGPRRLALAGSEWLWYLGPGVEALPEAVAAFARALERLPRDPGPSFLAGTVRDPDGRLDSKSMAVPEVHLAERIVPAVGAGCLALLAARAGSLLVDAGALEALGPDAARRFPGRELELTARLARRAPGYLVPESRARRAASPPLVGAAALAAARRPLIGGLRTLRALEGRERAWFAFHLAQRARLLARRGRRD